MHTLYVAESRDGTTHVYRVTGLSDTRGPDGLRRMFRQMVSADMRGAAQIVGRDGRVRMTCRSIEKAACYSIVEEDARGLRLVKFRDRVKGLAKAA
jgi:hypothetical protein